jgi:D-amino peptidase
MKIFISSDLEGAAGIVDWDQCRPSGGMAYQAGCELLLEEVNAAIEGAHDGGASEVLVNDSHGAMANLAPARLAHNASYLSGRHKPMYMMEGLDESFDGCIFLAYHGSINSSGTLSHTYNPRAIYAVRINGSTVGESGINALVAEALGVPIVLVTGDQFAVDEAKPIAPQARLLAVKTSITRFAARNQHPTVARTQIRSAAAAAVQDLGDESPTGGTARIFADGARLETDWLTSDMAEMATWVGGVDRCGERTTVIEGGDLLGTYRRFCATIAITRSIVE